MRPWPDIRAGIETPDKKRDYNARLFTRVAGEYDSATRAMSMLVTAAFCAFAPLLMGRVCIWTLPLLGAGGQP